MNTVAGGSRQTRGRGLRAWIERYLEYGWNLLLVRAGGKEPLPESHGVKDATDDLESLLSSLENFPGANLALACGPDSGVLVLDVDRDEGKGVDGFASLANLKMELGPLPETVTSRTPRGGEHRFFLFPAGARIKNGVSVGGHEGLDVRSAGGYAVLPPSRLERTDDHPGGTYEWIRPPGKHELAELPGPWAKFLSPPEPTPVPASREHRPTRGRGGGAEAATAWARTALADEVATVARAVKGERNDALNRAAFNLGQIVGGGYLQEEIVVERLFEGAKQSGLLEDDGEPSVRATIRSGLEGGKRLPRGPAERPAAPVTKPGKGRKPAVLVPGEHPIPDGFVGIGNDVFASSILEALPEGVLYRRGDVLGRLVEGRDGSPAFRAVGPEDMRLLVDEHVRLVRWRRTREGSHRGFVACTRDQGGIVLGAAANSPAVRDLRSLVNFPVYLPGFGRAQRGWNAEDGVYYAEPSDLRELEPVRDRAEARRILEELVEDFPFRSTGDRVRFFALLLTLLLRPALDGNVPFFVVVSPLPRSGKTKLASEVLGEVILGAPLPVAPVASREEEREKRLLSFLVEGRPVVLLDNLPRAILDSPSLAAAVTAREFSGRLLGQNRTVSVPNESVFVATANNPAFSDELALRTVPIRLDPQNERPDLRTEFRHPDLAGYVRKVRRRVLEALLGMVENWLEAGRPPGTVPLGGFEAWARTIGGILAEAGFQEFLDSREEWRAASDPWGEDSAEFVRQWAKSLRDPGTVRSATELMELAEGLGLFGDVFDGVDGSSRGRVTAFAMRVLRRLVDAPVAGHRVRKHPGGYRLEPIEGEGK